MPRATRPRFGCLGSVELDRPAAFASDQPCHSSGYTKESQTPTKICPTVVEETTRASAVNVGVTMTKDLPLCADGLAWIAARPGGVLERYDSVERSDPTRHGQPAPGSHAYALRSSTSRSGAFRVSCAARSNSMRPRASARAWRAGHRAPRAAGGNPATPDARSARQRCSVRPAGHASSPPPPRD